MNRFALAYREQQQLFLYDKTYIMGTLLKTGGLSTVIARFIVQFFWNPFAAMTLTVLLLGLSSYTLWAFLRTGVKDWQTLILCLVPSILIGISLSDNSLHFDYLTSILLVEAGLVICKKIRSGRILTEILLTIILYITSGPASLVFTISVIIYESRPGTNTKGTVLLTVVTYAACGIISYFIGQAPTLSRALTPAFHYDLDVSMPVIHWLGWLSVPLVTATSFLKGKKWYLPATSTLLLLSVSAFIYTSRGEESRLTQYEYEYYTVNEDWDRLEKSCVKHVWSPGTANYKNLASAYKGTLSENLLKHDNRGVSSLLVMPEDKTVDVRVSHIMYAMGNIAAAQNVAFNAMCTMEGYAPAMMKTNIKVELMRGAYDVAEKYLSILERTLHYRKWAQRYKSFLWNDSALANDKELSTGRKDLEVSDGFAMLGNPIDELKKVIEANPGDEKAMEYAISFLLLSKDIAGLQSFVDSYWGTGALTQMPVAAQEALIFYSEYSRNFENVEPIGLEWCLSHGVTPDTIRHFESFQQASIKSKGAAPSGFKGTYWNYLLYTQL